MAIILCLETSTTNCSVALSVDGKVVALKEDNSKQYSHAERLHVFIEELLIENNIAKDKLDAIAISKGPGSYTGLRIGVSAAKGLCFALEIPLISIPTLEVLAKQSSLETTFIIPMLDARRMEVYSSVFNTELNEIRETRAEILDQASFSEFLDKGKVIFIGSGVEKFKTICNHLNASFEMEKTPSSNEMAAIAEFKYKKSDTEDVAYFEPYYLKDFVTT